jgi:hypothetical protein
MTDTPKRKPGRPRKVAPATPTDHQTITCNQVTGREMAAETVLKTAERLNQDSHARDLARISAKQTILAAIALGQSATSGALQAGVSYGAPYYWRKEDPEFAAAWEKAYQAGTDVFEDAARLRAVDGVLRPVFQAGKKVGEVREFSDNVLIRFLERRAADWRQAKAHIEVTGANGGPIQIEAVRSRVLGKLAALAGGKVIDVKAE